MDDVAVIEDGLVGHARRELELCGQFREDPEFAESLVAAVAAFASYGHSGGSAGVGIAMLGRLLRFETLSPLTTRSSEWMFVTEERGGPLWQSRRDPAVFSEDQAVTAYRLVEGGRAPVELVAVQA